MKNLVNYVFEMSQLKLQDHVGGKKIWVEYPEKVAMHVYLAQIIVWMLALKEGADPAKVIMMILIHDNPETRILDLDYIAQKYNPGKKTAEVNAFNDQTEGLFQELKASMRDLFAEFMGQETPESRIAKDADKLEQSFQAKIYMGTGIPAARIWFEESGKLLQTESAKALYEALTQTSYTDWVQALFAKEGMLKK